MPLSPVIHVFHFGILHDRTRNAISLSPKSNRTSGALAARALRCPPSFQMACSSVLQFADCFVGGGKRPSSLGHCRVVSLRATATGLVKSMASGITTCRPSFVVTTVARA